MYQPIANLRKQIVRGQARWIVDILEAPGGHRITSGVFETKREAKAFVKQKNAKPWKF